MRPRRPTTLFTLTVLATLLANGCASRQNTASVQPLLAAPNSTQIDATTPTAEVERLEDNAPLPVDEEIEAAAAPDIYDAEFCRDNIYAQYLRDKYLRDNLKAANPERAFKPTGRRRRGVPTRSPYDAREVEALFYARSRLIGESVPYFGAIPVVTNPRVEHWVRYFKNSGRKAFLRWLVRGQSVQNVVLPLLKDQGLPPEFIFLSMVESGFSNSAYSRAKATGPWQFMPGTAKLYGLNMNMWIDERRDPAKSTKAAAKLLSDLYREFGDWYLAMAAYNAGPGRVRSAMRKSGSNNFWAIADSPYLPVETKNYVPKVLAALMLASNPSGHGFEVVADPMDVLPVTQVELVKPVSIQEISQKFEINERLIRHWNPELVNAVTPPGRNGAPYKLRVAPHLVERWADVSMNLTYLDVKDMLMHKIRKGDTLASIATRYRVDLKRILNVNPGLKTGRLKIGTEVAVPTAYMTPKNRAEMTPKAVTKPKQRAAKPLSRPRSARSG